MSKPMEFHVTFQITRLITFDVNWYTLGSNAQPYFTTSACRYVRSKRGYDTCGQCQSRVLTKHALWFWRKWDPNHLGWLSDREVAELLADLDKLAEHYNYVARFAETFGGRNSGTPETERYALSMQKLKK